MSLIYTRVNDQKIRDRIDMLPEAEHTLEKYILLGETHKLSEANAAAFNPQPTASVHALRYKGQGQHKGSGKPCSACSYKHKYGECKAKGKKCKKCDKVGHFAKMCRSKAVNTNSQNRSNNRFARFSGTKKVHMVTDDSEVQETIEWDTARERLKDVWSNEFVDTIDVFMEEAPTSQPRCDLDVHAVHKPKRYQAFTQVSMYP